MKRILFLTQSGPQKAASRHRVEQYLPWLEKAGFEAVVRPAILTEEFFVGGGKRSRRRRLRDLFQTFTRRVHDLHQIGDFDMVFVQGPILPSPLFNLESRFAREAPMIFDLDEASYLRRPAGVHPAPLWPQARRVAAICRRARRVVVDNETLAGFVRTQGVEPVVLPTPVDTDAYAPARQMARRAHKIPVLGWIGSPSTQSELQTVVPPLIALHSRAPFVVRLIGARHAALPARFPIEWKEWNLKTEVEDLGHLDCGLAPLQDTPWNRGKCALKVLQYWAAGVPVVASPVGVYREILRDGENGLLAATPAEWTEKVLALIKNPALRQRVIAGGLASVEEKFSLRATAPQFIRLFEEE